MQMSKAFKSLFKVGNFSLLINIVKEMLISLLQKRKHSISNLNTDLSVFKVSPYNLIYICSLQ